MPSLSFVNQTSMSLALASACLLGSAQVIAADPCDNPQTQAAMTQCAINDYINEDIRLNQIYKTLRSQLTTQEKSQLKSAQLAWINYRDKSCEFSTRHSVGGSIHGLEYNSCLSQMSAIRRRELAQEIHLLESR